MRGIFSSLFALLFFNRPGQGQTYDYFWHLTDFHLDTSYWTNPPNARNSSDFFNARPYDYEKCWIEGGGVYGDYNCDSPITLIQSAIQFVIEESASVEPKPKFVIWTGDDTVHADNSHFSEDIVVDILRQNTEAILPLLNDAQMSIFPVLGNHDAYPESQFPTTTSPGDFYSRIGDLWKDLIPTGFETFQSQGGCYLINKADSGLPFHLMGLNTNLYAITNNLVGQDETDPLGHFEWMKEYLDDFKSRDEKVFIFAHIAPGNFERYYQQVDKPEPYEGFFWFRPDFNDIFINEIILPYNDTIIAQFYGHHHTDTFKLFNDGPDFVSHAFLTPSVTPWRSTLSQEVGSRNPAVRLVKYDSTTGEILDIFTYWMNLKEANANGIAEWKQLYSFREEYNLEDLSTQSMAKLTDLLEPGADEEVFSLYYRLNSVNYDEYLEYNCTTSCQATQYCSLVNQRIDEFVTCWNQYLN